MRTLSILAGKILFGLVMIIFGIFHFMNGGAMTEYLVGWPFPIVFIYLSGAGLILTGLSIIVHKYTNIACWLLAVEIALFILCIHIPAIAYGSDIQVQMSTMNLLKDAGLLGGALIIAGLFEPSKER